VIALVLPPHRLVNRKHSERSRDVEGKRRARCRLALGTRHTRHCGRVVRLSSTRDDESCLALTTPEVAERSGMASPLFSVRPVPLRHGSSVSALSTDVEDAQKRNRAQ